MPLQAVTIVKSALTLQCSLGVFQITLEAMPEQNTLYNHLHSCSLPEDKVPKVMSCSRFACSYNGPDATSP